MESRWGTIEEKIRGRGRLDFDDGIFLFQTDDIHRLGRLANTVRERMHGDVTYYVRNLHINYTNICNKLCEFCAFYALPGESRAYTLSIDDIRKKVLEYRDEPLQEVHVVAGINPCLDYTYYLDLLRAIKEIHPRVNVKAFTMIELAQIHKLSKKPFEDMLKDLKSAGLDSLPGGGAEVFSQRVHDSLFKSKLSSDEWLEMARKVHAAGLHSNATLLYGHEETLDEKVNHLIRLRDTQDDTGGFLCFIPLAFHPENTKLSELPGPGGISDLRHIAVSRLLLDNFPHIKSYWVMVTPPVAQISLWYGADDMDGTIIEEKVTHAAGCKSPTGITDQVIQRLIREAGRTPVERDALYHPKN